MAVTFDHDISTQVSSNLGYNKLYIITYNGSTYTNYITKQTSFDYFRNNAAIGDIIYFGWNASVWHDLVVNVGTALVASSITLVWEYQDYNGIWQTLTVNDGTNSFRNTGVNTISFTVPDTWKLSVINTTIRGYFIRARITGVTSITEGGANATSAPTGKDYTIQVTGITETLETIYQASISNNWNVIVNIGMFYQFNCNFRIGNYLATTTIFSMLDEILQIGEYNRNWVTNKKEYYRKYVIFLENTTDIWNIGSSLEGGTQGCGLIYNVPSISNSPYNYWMGKIYAFNSLFKKHYGSYGQGTFSYSEKQISNSIFSPWGIFFINSLPSSGHNSFIKDTIVDMGSGTYWYVYSPYISFDSITFTQSLGILAQGASVSNINFGSTKKFYAYSQNTNKMLNCYMVDLLTQLTTNPAVNSTTNVVFTCDIIVLDILKNVLNPNIKITDNLGNIIYNGISMGQIELNTMRVIQIASGSKTITDFNPFTIEITMDGYETYKTIYNVTEKIDKVITLKQPKYYSRSKIVN